MRIAYVEDPAFSIAETAYEERTVVGAQAEVHGQDAFLTADVGDFLRLPLVIRVFVNKPEFRAQGRGGEGVIVARSPGPANFQRRAGDVKYFLRLARMEIPEGHRLAE